MNSAKERTKRHEGKRNKAYLDSKGVVTIGYGHSLGIKVKGEIERLAHRPLSDEEIELIFENDWKRATLGAMGFRQYESLSRARRGVLIEMVFQLGVGGVQKFKRFLAAIDRSDWDAAYDEMLDSKWHNEDSPRRAKELADIFLEG